MRTPANDNAVPMPTWRGLPIPLTREAIEAEIERLIDLLDVFDGDPDLEPDELLEGDGLEQGENVDWTMTGGASQP
jgi:hypothetical protein